MTRVDASSCFASMRTHLQCEILSKKKKKPKTSKIIGGKRIWTLTYGNNFLCTCMQTLTFKDRNITYNGH